MVIMRWNERTGAEIAGKYPDEIEVSEKTLMQVYSTHEYSGEPGMVSLMIGAVNVVSYFTGTEKSYYLVLLLTADEDPDAYEDGMADVARIILTNLENNAFKTLLPSLFQRLAVYPSLRPEQKLAMVWVDATKRKVIQRLQEEGAVSKSELAIWLKDIYQSGFVDIESIVASLVKENLVKGGTVKGMPSEVIFLTNDFMVARRPPVLLFNECASRGLPASLKEAYQNEVKSFFASYEPSEEDNAAILELLVNPEVYEALTLMRQAIVTRDDLEKLKKKGVEDVDLVLKVLWDSKMIAVLRDPQGNEYYGLKSDVLAQRFFPEYMVNVVRQNYKEKSKADAMLLEHLEILEEAYRGKKEKEGKKAARSEAAVKALAAPEAE
jgi:hypothetical protein